MGITLIFVRLENMIIDYRFYSKELAPISVMDDSFLGMVMLKEKKGSKSDICILKKKEADEYEENSASFKNQKEFCDNCSKEYDPGSQKRYRVRTLVCCARLVPIFRAVLAFDAHLVSCLICELSHSHKFRHRFVKWLCRMRRLRAVSELDDLQPAEYDPCIDCDMPIKSTIEIQPLYPRQKIDYAWCYRMEGQAARQAALEEAMAWLSTLGGGFSALGDYFQHHAEEAGRISFKQLRIAMEMGHPIIASKCKLFFAQSLMQRGYLAHSRRILRSQKKFAKQCQDIDSKLLAMWNALASRLKYLFQRSSVKAVSAGYSGKVLTLK